MSAKNPPLFQIASPGQEKQSTQITEITLRDLFAGLVLAGWAAHGHINAHSSIPSCVEAAASAYAIANWTLEEREKRTSSPRR